MDNSSNQLKTSIGLQCVSLVASTRHITYLNDQIVRFVVIGTLGSDTMRFFICPKCSCINKEDAQKCDNCGLPMLTVIMLPNVRWIQYESVEALHRWLKLMKRTMGSTLFTKLEAR